MSAVVQLVQPNGQLRRVLSHDEVLELHDARLAAELALEQLQAGNQACGLEILIFAVGCLDRLLPKGRVV